MANKETLKPFTSQQSREKAKINGRKGGIKSGESRRRQKTFREMAKTFNQLKPDKKILEQLKALGISENDATFNMAVMVANYQKAMKGDNKATENVQKWNGEDTKLNLEIERQKQEMELKEREYQLRLRELELKEKQFEQEMALQRGEVKEEEKVYIINDLNEIEKKRNKTKRANNT